MGAKKTIATALKAVSKMLNIIITELEKTSLSWNILSAWLVL
jgi:hypothetical protein